MIKKLGFILLFSICYSTSHSTVFLAASYVPVGGVEWHWNGGQDWAYERTDATVGFGWRGTNNLQQTLVFTQTLLLNPDVGLTGTESVLKMDVGKVFFVEYAVRYRWYAGSGGDYGYATGAAITHNLRLHVEVPLFGGN